jgi:2,3-bisphosphoglycerate-independent phosphoglycerate mutase
MPAPLLLAILDGFGDAEPSPGNAITLAEPAFFNGLRERFPSTLLECSGEAVGLPCGLMGNSEVGHLNIGAGRIVWQEITRIDRAIRDGRFFANEALLGAVRHALSSGGTLHLLGLVSDGGVHSSDRHVEALLQLARDQGLGGGQVQLHAFLDGRDTPPRSAQHYVAGLEKWMAELGVGRIATVSGRYYAMDRDTRWDRTRRAYEALVHGEGTLPEATSALAAIRAAYEAGVGDEFVEPVVVAGADSGRGRIRDGDAAIFFNFRADRTRQLTRALTSDRFDEFDRGPRPDLHLVTMTRYREDFTCPVAFAPQYLKGIFPEVVSGAGMSQLRIAETEKYAHVTFFLSGGDEKEYPGERRILVPSPRVATYDLQPEMSAFEVTDRLLAAFDDATTRPDVTVLNFANADMVGHTGNIAAAIVAVKTIDRCLERIVPRYLAAGGTVAITADHGNCEMMLDPETGSPHTAHTTNPVPLVIAAEDLAQASLRAGGRLCDIATTLLPLLGLAPHPNMEGVDLL